MRCKDCKEKIPDNVKYCPECGALVNDIKYNINNHTVFNAPVQPVHNEVYNPPEQKKNILKKAEKPLYDKQKVTKIAIALIVAAILCITAFVPTVEEILIYDDDIEYTEEIDVFSYAEDAACTYVNHLLYTYMDDDYNIFNGYTTIDWDTFCADVTGAYDGYYVAGAAYEALITEKPLFESLSDGFSGFYLYTGTVTVYEYPETQKFTSTLEELISPCSLSAEQYIPYSDIEEIISVEFTIEFENEFGVIFAKENIEVIVAHINDEYFSGPSFGVLYDSFFIKDFIASFYPEEYSTVLTEIL